MLVGRWWQRLPPLPGELLSSCLARNAAAHGTTPYRFLALFWHGDPAWERDFDRDPAALRRRGRGAGARDWLADLAIALRVDRAVLEGATLVGERRALAGMRRLGGDTPLVLSAGIHHRTRTRHALQFCPECLAEGTPHFRKAWRIGFMVACGRHGTALADACPHCDAAVAPHRSMTRRSTDCHRCGRSILGRQREGEPMVGMAGASAMQGWMSSLLDGEDRAAPAPWEGREAFDAVRALLAVSAAAPVRERLRVAFALGGMDPPGDRMRFEHARLAVRAPWLETVGAWMADWPRGFRNGADAAGVTRRTFARVQMPRALADEVACLPAGITRDRTWVPVLDEPVLRKLRRTDRAAYSRVRAERILAHCGAAR